jgi:transposase
MEHFVGPNVSVRGTSVCVVDETGKLLKEAKISTEPKVIASLLAKRGYARKWVGLQARPMSQWLYAELAAAGSPVICVETRHMRSALAAQPNKADRNDARGIAQMMRVGLDRSVHVQTLQSQDWRLLLTARKLLQAKLLDIERDLRGTVKNFLPENRPSRWLQTFATVPASHSNAKQPAAAAFRKSPPGLYNPTTGRQQRRRNCQIHAKHFPRVALCMTVGCTTPKAVRSRQLGLADAPVGAA